MKAFSIFMSVIFNESIVTWLILITMDKNPELCANIVHISDCRGNIVWQ